MHSICFLLSFSLFFFITSCGGGNAIGSNSSPEKQDKKLDTNRYTVNIETDVIPLFDDGDVNALIEIPAGTLDKWELNKSTSKLEWQLVDKKPRVVNYVGYPGNYGMIPRTLLPKEKGGDGDPLDIIVLGPPAERGQVVKCKIIGVLYLLDSGEQDDKLIAVSKDSPLYHVNSINELNDAYKGITEIIQLWFANYKGPGIMEAKGFGNKKSATDILHAAINEYQLLNSNRDK